MPKSVLITFDTHTPYLAFRVTELQKALVARGLADQVRLEVILLAAEETTYKWESGEWAQLYGGVPVTVLSGKFRTPGLRVFLKPAVWWSCCKMLHHFFRLWPRVAFVGGYDRPESLTIALWSYLTRCKVGPLHDSRFNDAEGYSKSLWLELAKGLMVRHYDFFMCSGRECAEYSRFLGGGKKPAWTGAWDVVDNEKIGSLAESSARDAEILAHLEVPPGRPFFFMPIRFLAKKNGAMVIDAYAAYRQKAEAAGLAPAQLVICGQGPLEEEFRRQAQQLGLEALLKIRPWLRYDDVPRACRLSLAVLLASTHDQWGMTINETLAAGAPVLCSSRAGAHEIVRNNVNGFTFHPWEPEHLAALLHDLAHDESLVEKFRQNAAPSVRTFSVQEFLDACFAAFTRYGVLPQQSVTSTTAPLKATPNHG